jgi:hypothetical protein
MPPEPEYLLPSAPEHLLPSAPDDDSGQPTGPFEQPSEHDFEHHLGDDAWPALLDAVIGRLPEFLPTYLALAEACDDDPGEPAVFIELADFVAERLAALERGRPELERALDLVEAHLDEAGDTGGAADLVGLAFFDSFSPEDRRRLLPWLGPRSLATLEALDVPSDERDV